MDLNNGRKKKQWSTRSECKAQLGVRVRVRVRVCVQRHVSSLGVSNNFLIEQKKTIGSSKGPNNRIEKERITTFDVFIKWCSVVY